MRRSRYMRIDTKRIKPGTGLANYEVDGNPEDEEGSKLQRRHSDRQSLTIPRERRRNSAPSTALKLPRFFSRESTNVSAAEEWKTCNSIKLVKGSDTGRVKVFVRIRPFRHEDAGKGGGLPFTYDKDEGQISMLSDDKSSEKTITFDHLFTQEENNQQVCNTLTGPLIHSAMNGFNGTLMAYGQTCSGKTYTLMSDTGITQSLVKRCFARIQGASKHNFKVTVSYLQIYQEKIYDLLKDGSENIELAIRENPHTGIYVENLTEYVVRSPHEVQQYISKGQESLMFSETKMNQCSSRSHAVLQITIERTKNDNILATSIENDIDEDNEEAEEVESKDKISKYLDSFGKDVIIRGKIHICDLAGSERIKRAGDNRLLETQAINSSLLELGNVIQALADEKATHVPYRNSMLTRLLQESLGGNCKTGLIICISPSPQDYQETKCSLNFGQRASKVRNKAYINMEVDYKKLSEHLMKEIDAKEIEMRQIRIAKVEANDGGKRENLQKRYEEIKRESQVQKELHTKELEELQEEIFVLNEQVYTHKEQIADCESSAIATNDAQTSSKNTSLELMKTENAVGGLFDRISICNSNEQFSLLRSFYKLLLMYSEDIKSDDVFPDVALSEYFSLLRDKAENIQIDTISGEANIKGLTEMKVVLDKMRNDLIDENVSKLTGIDEDKTSDSGIEEDKLTDAEVNVLRYKLVLKGFVNFTTNSVELLHVRLKSESFEEDSQKLSSDFQSYKLTKDLLFTELARARKEERDFLANENRELQSKINVLEENIKEHEEDKQNTREREDSERIVRIQQLEEENREITSQFQNYKLTTELSHNQMEKSRRAEKEELSKEMNEEISRLQRDNNGLLSRIREYTTTIKEQGSEIMNLNNIIRKMEYEIKELGFNTESYDRRTDSMGREHAQFRRDQHHTSQSSDATEIVNMEAEIETLNLKIREYKKNEMDKDDEILKLQLESINRICDTANFTTVENQTEINVLIYKIESMEGDIEKLQSKITKYKKQLLEKKEEVVNLREEHRESLNLARESSTMYSMENEANVKELSEQIAIADIEVTDLHSKIDILERAVKVKKIEISKLRREHSKALARACDSSSATVEQESEIKNLNTALAKTDSENDQLRSEIKMFERKAADKENDLVKIRKLHNEELGQMRESAASLSRENEMSLTKRINEIRDLNVALAQLETRNEELVYKVKVFDRKEEDMENEISRLLAERDDSLAHFRKSLSTSKENERELDDLNNKIAEIEIEKKDLQSKVNYSREREEYTKKEILELRQDYNEAEKQAQEASSIVREKENKIADLNNLIKEVQDENVKLYSKVSAFEKSSEDMQNENIRLQKEYNESLAQIRGCSSTVNERKSEVASMNITIMKLEAENETFQSKVKYLEQREEDNRNELKSLHQERSDSVKQVLECASTARERENEMKSMNIKLTQIENDNDELRAKVKMFDKKKEENKKKFAKLQSDHEDVLTSTMTKNEKDVKEVRSQLTKLEDENEELRSIRILERREEDKNNVMGKQKGSETITRVGHTIYTTRYHGNDSLPRQTNNVKEANGEISKMNFKLTELEMENHELRSKIKVFQEVIEEDKKNEIQQNDKILQVQTAHHSLWSELETCKSMMEEKENTLKKMNPQLAEIKHEKGDLLVKLEAYKQIIKQKESKIKELEGKLNDLGKNEYPYNNKLNKRNNETIALQTANEKLLAQITSYKSVVDMHKKSNEEAHEEITKLALENSNLMSQFDCFLSAINRKEKLCKKLVAKVCDLEVINEKLFESISQSVNDNAEQDGEDNFGKACKGKMKDLLANALVEQEERLVAEITTENVYESTIQRSERISVNTSTMNVPRRGLSDKSLMSSVYNTLKSAEKAQMDIKEKLSAADHEVTELQNKSTYLEACIMKLQKEKKEYLGIILELTHSSREEKAHNGHHCHDNHNDKTKVDNYSQTDDLSTQHSKGKHPNSKGKHALKVAHIKPLVNNETDKDNGIMDTRDASERVKVENGGRDEYNIGRGNQFSSFGSSLKSDIRGNVDNNTKERRRQETTRYSSVSSKENETHNNRKSKGSPNQYIDNTRRNSNDATLSTSSPLHSIDYTEDSEVRSAVQEKEENEHVNGDENNSTFNTGLSTKYTDDKRNDRSELKPLPRLPTTTNDYEGNAINYGKSGYEYLEGSEKKSTQNCHMTNSSKYVSRQCNGSSQNNATHDGSNIDFVGKYNDDKTRESSTSRSPTSSSNTQKDYEGRSNNIRNDFNGYHESKEKTIEVCSAYLSSKCIDGKENENLKLKPSTHLSDSKKYPRERTKIYGDISNEYRENTDKKHPTSASNAQLQNTYIDNTTNDISKVKPCTSEPIVTAPVTGNPSIYISKYSTTSRLGTKEKASKIANRYGLEIDLTEEGSPSSHPYSSHYNSIIHKYDKFTLPSKR